jgi:hypothetical protein
MSKRWQRGMAAHRDAQRSWSIKWAVKDEDGNITRWRHHYKATLGYKASSAEHAAKREEARTSARAKAKALTQDPNVIWVTVYPPSKYHVFNLSTWTDERLAPVSRWTRSKGWTQEEKS